MDLPRIVTAFAEWCSCLFYILPFDKRIKNKLFFWFVSGVFLLLQSFLQINLCSYTNVLWLYGMGANLLCMVMFIYTLKKCDIKEAFYFFARAFVTAEFLASTSWIVFCEVVNFAHYYGKTMEVFFIVFEFICFYIALYMIHRKEIEVKEKIRIDWRQTLLAVVISYVSFISSNLWLTGPADVRGIDPFYQFLRTSVSFSGMLILFLQQRSIMERQLEQELKAISNTLDLQYKQYLEFKETSEYIARQSHDLKHQITAIRNACTNEEREDYLKQMEAAVKKYQTWNVSGNSILDTILTQKKQYCMHHGIQLTCSADGEQMSFLAVRDICTIFGNLLDNAIEAVSLVPNEDERLIHGEIYRRQDFLVIKFENCYNQKYQVGNTLPKTTKTDKNRHGYGLKSMKHLVEKYNGSMKISVDDSWFVLKILIPIPGSV